MAQTGVTGEEILKGEREQEGACELVAGVLYRWTVAVGGGG